MSSEEHFSISTSDGECHAFVFTPGGQGPYPAVILYMDGFGIRPTILDMARRLSEAGYVVLVPDLFYRAGEYGPLNPNAIFASGNVMDTIGELYSSTNPRLAATDTAAFLDFLDWRPDVDRARIGTTGYCLGGAVSLTVAGTYPDRIKATASFHAGSVVTDAESSPHRLVPNIKARVYVAGADHDASYTPENAATLDDALRAAGVEHRCEIYKGARHGFTMTDFPVYDQVADERHWREMLTLFGGALK